MRFQLDKDEKIGQKRPFLTTFYSLSVALFNTGRGLSQQMSSPYYVLVAFYLLFDNMTKHIFQWLICNKLKRKKEELKKG